MHPSSAYRAKNPRALVEAYALATVFTSTADGLFSTASPLYFETDHTCEMRIIGHFSGANPHARVLAPGQDVLAVFTGPHAYVSPRWYVDKPTVPTWDYVSAEVRGTLTPVDAEEDKLHILRRTVEKAEQGAKRPWTLQDAPDGKIETLLPRIRAFRILVSDIVGTTKLHQTHPEEDRARVAAKLEERGGTADREVARFIRTPPE
ncbi:MAG: FMN-binding negative transcriptional regulator [Pseudomonadota bacterium]